MPGTLFERMQWNGRLLKLVEMMIEATEQQDISMRIEGMKMANKTKCELQKLALRPCSQGPGDECPTTGNSMNFWCKSCAARYVIKRLG